MASLICGATLYHRKARPSEIQNQDATDYAKGAQRGARLSLKNILQGR